MTRLNKLPPLADLMDPEIRAWLDMFSEPAASRKVNVTHTFTLASTEYRIRHKLGAIPTGFRVIDRDAGGTIYRDSSTTKATKHFIYLKSDTAGLTVTLEIS